MTITRYRKTRFGRYGMQTERWSPSVSTRRARRKSCAVCKTSNTKGWELNLGSVPSPGERRSAGRIRLARARRSDLGGSLTMSSTQERIKKRQEYLKKKAGAYANMSIYALITLPLSLVAGFSLIAVMLYLYDYISGKPSPDYGMSGLFSIIAVIFGGFVWLFARFARQAHQEAKQLPYVPPIAADTLPAEEVLVRGSEQPAQEQGKVLLRGTGGSQ